MLTFLQSQNDRTLMKGYRRVAFVEEFWDILKQIHNNDTGTYICRLHKVSWSFWTIGPPAMVTSGAALVTLCGAAGHCEPQVPQEAGCPGGGRRGQ